MAQQEDAARHQSQAGRAGGMPAEHGQSEQRSGGTAGERHGDGHDTAGSGSAGDGVARDGTAGGGGRAAGKRRREKASGEMAVVRFAAFAAGVNVDGVRMVGGVHVLAGSKRTVAAAEERVVAERDERGERRERRERRRAAAEPREERPVPVARRRRANEAPGSAGSLEGAGDAGGCLLYTSPSPRDV